MTFFYAPLNRINLPRPSMLIKIQIEFWKSLKKDRLVPVDFQFHIKSLSWINNNLQLDTNKWDVTLISEVR